MNRLRNLLEWISAPLFALLVVHMGGHGLILLADPGHSHAHADEHGLHLVDILLSTETLSGVLLLIIFVWLWNKTSLRKFVPCRHTGCTHTTAWPHLIAVFAFVLHFFPEAHLRAEFLSQPTQILSLAGLLAFGVHFLVDIIVGISLSLYWQSVLHRVLTGLGIAVIWGLAMYMGTLQAQTWGDHGLVMIIGAFLLAMFIHWPDHSRGQGE